VTIASSLLSLRVPPHRATTRNLQAAYPFVVDSSLASRGAYVGRQAGSDGSFVFDPWELYTDGVITNPNILLAGVIGRGKSALAKSLALRMTAFGVRVYVPCDPKGEWGAVARALGSEPVALGRARRPPPTRPPPRRPGGGGGGPPRAPPGGGGGPAPRARAPEPVALGRGLPHRVNPLDPGPRPAHLSTEEWAREVEARRINLLSSLSETALDRRLTPVERTALVVALGSVDAETPVLPHVVEGLMTPTREAAATLNMTLADLTEQSRNLALELRRLVIGDLAGLFDGPTTHPVDFDSPIQVLDTSRLAGDDTAVALLMTCASAWMESALTSATNHRRLVVYDEAWRMLRHLALVRRMQAQWKLSRAIGVANLAVVHRISDLGAVGASGSEAVALAQGLLADCSTRVAYAQESDQVGPTANALGLTDVEAEQLVHLPRGRGLWKVGRHSAIVDHVLGPAEHAIVDTDARMRSRNAS
jgi:hypothetical protein